MTEWDDAIFVARHPELVEPACINAGIRYSDAEKILITKYKNRDDAGANRRFFLLIKLVMTYVESKCIASDLRREMDK